MIDLHSHILPGIDDGAQTIDDSRELAMRAAADGIGTIAATPHVRTDYPTTPEQMEQGVALLRADFAREAIPVEVVEGGEVDLEALGRLDPEEIRRFTLGQTGRYLLVECPYYGWPPGLEQRLFDLVVTGVTPIFAHPERNSVVQASPARLEALVEGGSLVQVTAASLDGRIGRRAEQTATKLVRDGLAHILASDAHTPEIRAVGLAEAVRAVGNRELARYLTEDAPAAIVAGEDVPPRPAKRRRLFGR
ncbi:MAG TPA: CpsB/CapC family capsule biosynthesis tyrosine phosphatase [Gaiellaceae bacterium]|nr:CpsB/CapC family capsule biosynthesis tyrosine phosphatase [Gaiellaceae bacterium]